MKIEHRFSFFIFQLTQKMKDPKIHAFRKNTSPKKTQSFRGMRLGPRADTCKFRGKTRKKTCQ